VSEIRLVIHGHFYQPPRENPWTEEVATEPSAAPYHDWNERISAESYRPNGWARVLDPNGRVTEIVNNYEHLSFNVGPTLLSWLETHQPDIYERMLEADRVGGGAIAQAYNHMILPLATERDIRTQVRWGLADFAHRFGRRAEGLWLSETAVNDAVLAVLVEEGVRFTILAPAQAVAVRPLDDPDAAWEDVSDGSIGGGQPHRWFHPDGSGRHMDLVFYDGPISHDLAFGLTGLSSQELVRRVVAAAADGTPVAVATDGETFGHHHKFADRALAYAFAHEADAAGVRVLNAAELVDDVPPMHEVRVQESAWSCVHGVRRWKDDCGCYTGGAPDWNQAWRGPLRDALDVLRDHGASVFERRGGEVLRDPWSARDAYIDLILGRRTIDDFLAEHRVERGETGGDVTALSLLEAQRHALLMYTSCGWFFNDLAGIETQQVLRYAARTMDLLDELDEPVDRDRFFAILGSARSNDPEEGDGCAIWAKYVEPSRVDAGRVVAHLALVTLLEDREPPSTLGGYTILDHQEQHRERGGLGGVAGQVALEHGRTRRRTTNVYAAVHLGGLEVFGATRPADGDRDIPLFAQLAAAVSNGERVTTLLRLIADGFGPREFGLDSALPDAGDQIVRSAAQQLADRFGGEYERLYKDHRPTLDALLRAGYALPPELRAPAEFALARRFENEIARAVDEATADSFREATAIVREARDRGFHLDTPRAAGLMSTLDAAVIRAIDEPDNDRLRAALALVWLIRDLDLYVDVDRAQERLLGEVRAGRDDLRPLAEALNLAF
jgi:alpha-amylase/alpha-mannosidase (GH57 family)